jgi:hypothetical protein
LKSSKIDLKNGFTIEGFLADGNQNKPTRCSASFIGAEALDYV